MHMIKKLKSFVQKLLLLIFNRYESCYGITLFRSKTKNIEIWYCPARYEIKEHSHPKENIELVFIYGDCIFNRRNNGIIESIKVSRKNFLKSYTILYSHSHWFTTNNKPLIFLNIAKFKEGEKPVSACKDFIELKES